MPRDTTKNVYVQVPFPIGSEVLAELEKEAKARTGKSFVGPYIAELCMDRHAQIQGKGKSLWLPPGYLTRLETNILSHLDQKLSELGIRVVDEPVTQESAEEIIRRQAREMAAAFADEDDD